ncbi:uncharacterized protein KGF55_000654 [Candida pseudojiufengensis]|uniref:uncharacterized protein n=1 Tax=Candida pseudojiufengensis TaxID=497109 RepID=UPI0022246176|nr:uncharacterized protein KGF55_000654 [Candida pseudojiufengensis]KAI5966345.1 hypothetical protein KGF55_000654 [Candida pseudojiufengensis]
MYGETNSKVASADSTRLMEDTSFDSFVSESPQTKSNDVNQNQTNRLEDFSHLRYQYRSSNSIPRRFIDRKNSVIIASTGERVQRSITFSLPQDFETTPEGEALHPQTRFQNFLHLISSIYNDDIIRSVMKCSIAYFIASLGVFIPKLDELLGNTDSKHIIATVAVYFHPTRTKGSMNQTMIYVIISILFSMSVSFGCRLISAIFFVKGEDEISHFIDLLVSSIALGVISFWKQKVNKQTFNTACSLACISIVSCIVKEGSLNSGEIPLTRIYSTFQVVVTGCVISFACCRLIWPVSATNQLKKTIHESYKNYSLVLLTLTRRFVAGEKLTAHDSLLIEKIKKSVSLLYQYLEETQYELRLVGKEAEWIYYKELVNATISLARHLQALSAATRMQWSLLNTTTNDDASTTSTLKSFKSGDFDIPSIDSVRAQDQVEDNDMGSSLQLFDLFVFHLSPSIKSLVFTMRDILNSIPPDSFENSETYQHSLISAIKMYEKRQDLSFEHIYNQESFTKNTNVYFKAEQEEVAACCGNFATLLSQFATELLSTLKLFDEYGAAVNSPRSWPWLNLRTAESFDESTNDTSLHAALDDLRDQYGLKKHRPPILNSFFQKVGFLMWKKLKVLKRADVQFGIRVGLGAACLSLFAYIPETRDIFLTWRLEWALTVYCIMMNKSLGGTTMTVKWRIIGTTIGAVTAYLIWIIFDANVYFLAISGFLISIPSFYIILFWSSNNAFGRFILLTYNLTMLYSYSMIQKDSEDDKEGGDHPVIGEIAFHRFAAISIGIIWALTMATWFLPNSARARLKNGLSILWLRLGVIWNSDPLEYNPNTMELVGFKAEEGTNKILSECETLLKQAPVEFRLKGTFPTQTYSKILKETSAIIDAFQNLDLLIKVDPVLTPNEEYVLKYIESERNEVEQRIFLVFYMLASAMKLGFSVPKKFASIEHAKYRLLYKLSEIRQQQDSGIKLRNTDFIWLYSYILVATTISEQLDNIMANIKDLLGEISEEKFQLV